ncbi:MAG: hypothetical protein NUV92_08080 [Ignavibacteria bacterium]|jgi:hypothetical protein|nr:hypothetical protein [Ignavibacteria bacterium]MDH7528015.1 hypothetical protein [Ignavibacteria bacterium]
MNIEYFLIENLLEKYLTRQLKIKSRMDEIIIDKNNCTKRKNPEGMILSQNNGFYRITN